MTDKLICPLVRACGVRGKNLNEFERSVFSRWRTMMARCYNPNRQKYKDYGQRGIKVCKDWHDVRIFAKWCKISGYQPGLQLDRIDNNKGYSPQNCRWVSAKENSQNRRNTIFLTALGITLCVSEWARKLDISCYTIYWWAKQDRKYAEKRIEETILTRGGLL